MQTDSQNGTLLTIGPSRARMRLLTFAAKDGTGTLDIKAIRHNTMLHARREYE
jgi:hypothetical protein